MRVSCCSVYGVLPGFLLLLGVQDNWLSHLRYCTAGVNPVGGKAPDAIAPGAITSCSGVSEFCMVFHFLFHFWYSHCDTGKSASARPKNIPTPARRESTAPAPCRKPSPRYAKRYTTRFRTIYYWLLSINDRTGWSRRIREEAGDTFPSRAPAACIPEPVIDGSARSISQRARRART